MHHPHHRLPGLWHLRFDLQFENHLSNLLPELTSQLILQHRTLELLDHQPLPDRLKNLNLPSCQTQTIPTSIKPPQKIPMSVSEDKSIEKTPHQSQVRHPLQLGPETVPKLPNFDTLELQARVIMSKASYVVHHMVRVHTREGNLQLFLKTRPSFLQRLFMLIKAFHLR